MSLPLIRTLCAAAMLSAAFAPAGAIDIELASGGKMQADRVEFDGHQFVIYQSGSRQPLPPAQVRFLRADEQSAKEAQRLQTELESARAEVARLRDEKTSPRQGSDDLRTLGAKLSQAQGEIESLTRKLAEREREKTGAERNVTSLRDEMTSKTAALQNLRSDIQSAREQAARADARCRELEAKVTELTLPPPATDSIAIGQVGHAPSMAPGLVDVIGEATNQGKTPCKTVVLEAALYDAAGKLLQTASTYLADLQPGQTRGFKMDAPAAADKVARVDVKVGAVFPHRKTD